LLRAGEGEQPARAVKGGDAVGELPAPVVPVAAVVPEDGKYKYVLI
jgi:hypothetical protein